MSPSFLYGRETTKVVAMTGIFLLNFLQCFSIRICLTAFCQWFLLISVNRLIKTGTKYVLGHMIHWLQILGKASPQLPGQKLQIVFPAYQMNQGLSQDWEFTSPKNIIRKGWVCIIFKKLRFYLSCSQKKKFLAHLLTIGLLL